MTTSTRVLSDNPHGEETKMEERIAQHVQVLSAGTSEENVLKSLQDLSILVDSRTLNSEQLQALIPPSLLFRRLALNRTSEISYCIVVLKKLLNYMKPEIILTEYEFEAMQGVNHPSVEVRQLCLHQVERCVQTNSGVLKVIQNLDLLNFVIRNLGHADMGCAKVATNILLGLSRHSDGLALLLDANHESEFSELMKSNETVCFRVYELFVKIFEAKQEAYEKLKPIFVSLAAEVNSDDVLVQMNCIELLTDLIGINEVAYHVPEETGVNQKLYNILTSSESNPLAGLLMPAVIKFFGFLAIKNPQFVYDQYPQFYQFIFNCITSSDPSFLVLAVDTVGVIGSSNEGLLILFQNETQRNIVVAIGNCLQNADEQMKVHCLDCLASLFASDEKSDKNILDLIHSLYKKLDANPLQMLFQVLKQPFNSVRKLCLKTFYNLVSYEWMLADIKNIPGFFEFLLDRRTENQKECQELKYEVIKKMSLSPFISNVFDKPSILKLRQFVRDGPFYVGSDVSVSVDENQ